MGIKSRNLKVWGTYPIIAKKTTIIILINNLTEKKNYWRITSLYKIISFYNKSN